MKSNYLTAISLAAALVILTGCSDQSTESGEALPAPAGSTDAARSTEPSPQDDGGVVTPQEAEESEFAALDTNSNGTLEEGEWESDQARNVANLKNMTFEQIDRNASGGIEPEEFSKARSVPDAEENTGTGADTAVREPGADEVEPTGP